MVPSRLAAGSVTVAVGFTDSRSGDPATGPSGVGRAGVLSPLRNRFNGLTRCKKLRLATVGAVALTGAVEVVIKGASGEASAGTGAFGTSCAGLKVGCGTNLTTSACTGGGATTTRAGFGTLVATGLGALAIRGTFVSAGFGGLTFGLG